MLLINYLPQQLTQLPVLPDSFGIYQPKLVRWELNTYFKFGRVKKYGFKTHNCKFATQYHKKSRFIKHVHHDFWLKAFCGVLAKNHKIQLNVILNMRVNVNFSFRVQMINSLSGPWSTKEIVNRKDNDCMQITNYLKSR